ncbi:MAG TPA: ATP-binding protein [Chloroflexia bacterium]|nr:ATP-binding protein [Chloroflexia bacterium]
MRAVHLPSHWAPAEVQARARGWLEVVSVDQLDAVLRGLAVGIVVLLSLVGYTTVPHDPAMALPITPAAVAFGLVLYNVAVVLLLGVPWRRRPGFMLFVLDWAVVTGAVLLTGGFYSPFLVLYYALVIGAALRLDFGRTLGLVAACSLVYAGLSRIASPALPVLVPWLAVGITSLLMVAMTAQAMRRAVDVENARLRLERQTAQRFALLNDLTRAVLSATPDSAALLRTVAAVAPDALQADCALAVLLDSQGRAQRVAADQGRAPDLTPGALALVLAAAQQGTPLVIEDVAVDARGADLRECLGHVAAAVCAPLLLDERAVGALIVGSYSPRRFTPADVSLLTAIGRQIGLSVRLAQLYDLEREKAASSAARELLERDLLNTVSHELRTPLTAIKTAVSGLLAGPATRPAPEQRLLQNVDRSTERLILLVNDLLDMARLRAGRVTLARERLDLHDVIADAVAAVRPLVEAKNQALRIETGSGALEISGDRRRLEQVLLNMLYNANKYTPSGGEIAVGATAEHGQARVWVQDSGPGIAPTDQQRIFERFYVAGSNHARGDATGLGLAIAQSLIELHGGTIGVASSPGSGSRFFFTVPEGAPALTTDG